MKRFLLGLVFVAGLCLNVDAANPSFSSFATNQFITNNFLIRVRLNPAQFDTNASSVTITLTNVAGVPGGGTLWTNSAGVLQPLGHIGGTNQFTIAEASGWTGTGTNAFFDDGTFNGVAVINPTDGYIPYRMSAYEFGDSPWYRISTNKVGFNETNQFIYAHPDYAYPDSGVLAIGYEALASLSGSHPASRTVAIGERTGNLAINARDSVMVGWESGAYATNIIASVLIGTPNCDWSIEDSVLIGVNVSDGIRRSLYNTHIGYQAAANTLNVITNSIAIGYQAGATNDNEIVIGNANNTKAIFPITSYTGAGTLFLSDDGTYKAAGGSGTTINPTDGVIPYRASSSTFSNSIITQLLPNFIQIQTNSPSVTVRVQSASAASVSMIADNGFAQIGSDSSTPLLLSAESSSLGFDNSGFYPASSPLSLGKASVPWGAITTGPANNGSDYAIMQLYHGGSNSAAIINSYSVGGAGAARPVNIQVGNTNTIVHKADRLEFYNDGTKKWTMISGNLYPESTSDVGTSGNPIGYLYATGAKIGSCWILSGAGSPEGVTIAGPGSLYMRNDGGAGTSLYVKESGVGNTGWVPK